MGCFVAHDHPGTETTFWLGVHGICPPGGDKGIACHDLGLYEALWSLSMFGLFAVIDRFRPLKPGSLVLGLGLVYGPVRFLMDFLRPEQTDARYLGFTPGQYGALLLTGVCLAVLLGRSRTTDPPLVPVVAGAGGQRPGA